MGDPLSEVLAAADSFRAHALELFGPFTSIVTTSAQIVAGVLALLLLGAGRGLWAPPRQQLRDFAPRIAGLLGVVAVLVLFLASRDPESTLSFLAVSIWASLALALSAVTYLTAYQNLTFHCTGAKAAYVRGFFLQADARRVLENDQGPPPLPTTRTITGGARPTDACDYFCKSDREKPEWVWTKGSLVAAQLVLTLLYIPFALSIIVLLASAALAVQQASARIIDEPRATVARVPADLLFDYDKSDLRPDAQATLESIAQMIRQRWKSGKVTVVGYTDSNGADAYNEKLSLDRADKVVRWLTSQEQLSVVPFEALGKGKEAPVAPNTLPDGTDNPEGRRRNRRVVVTVPHAEISD